MTMPVFITGFEYGVASPNVNGGGLFNTISGSPSIQNSIKKSGNYALRINSSSSIDRAVKTISGSIVVGRVYFYVASYPTTNSIILAITSIPGWFQFSINSSDHKLYIDVNGSSPVASANALSLGTWYRLDFKLDASASTWYGYWQIDGTSQTNYSVSMGASTTLDGLQLGCQNSSTMDVYYDDVIISVTSGDYPIGPGYTEGLSVGSDGTHNAGPDTIEDNDGNDIGAVTAYDHINSVPIGNTTTYIEQFAIAASNYAEVNFADTSHTTIFGARAYLAYQSSGANENSGGCIIIDEDATQTTVFGDPTTRADYSETSVFYKSVQLPSPSGGWDKNAVNALKARLGYSNDVVDIPYWVDMIIEVAYSELSESASPSVSPSASASQSASMSSSPSSSISPSSSQSASPSASPSASESSSPSSGPIEGSTCWGHSTGVAETNVRTFADHWTGTGTRENSGDAERLRLDPTENMVSEVVYMGTYTVELDYNHYAAGDTIVFSYRHGATQEACEAASWNAYTVPFACLGYVQVKVAATT